MSIFIFLDLFSKKVRKTKRINFFPLDVVFDDVLKMD